jgi:hypothetical protein
MTAWKTRYQNSEQNAEIAAAGYGTFGQGTAQTEARNKYGSFNFFCIINQSAEAITIDLDGDSSRRYILFGNAVITLAAEEGIHFDWLHITNQSAANAIAAAEITITYGRADYIQGA